MSIEYLSKQKSDNEFLSSQKSVPVKDGITAIPIELSGYFNIPLGVDKFDLYIGGGCGLYLGYRQYEYAEIVSKTVEVKPGLGIHIISGAQYEIYPKILFRTDIKFRNVQFETVNVFNLSYTNYNGSYVSLPQEPLESRINIDGMIITFGLAMRF